MNFIFVAFSIVASVTLTDFSNTTDFADLHIAGTVKPRDYILKRRALWF